MSTPSEREGRLVDGRADPPAIVPATVIRDLDPARLADVERSWKPAREEADAAGFEHGHWDWALKLVAGALDGHRLVAVRCRGEFQGLMAVAEKVGPIVPGAWDGRFVYVDYLEVAPWNLKMVGRRPRFLGAGTALIAEAVRLSLDGGLAGRVGLHSLPQAEGFYAVRCGMRRVDVDPNYQGLAYFEYDDGVARRWLTESEEKS
jgi:hypothetical protein